MKSTTQTLFVAAIVAVGAGFIGMNFAQSGDSPAAANFVVPASMAGHVELEVIGSDGYIKDYVRTDNAIVNNGEDCIAKMLFKGPTSTGTNTCTGSITAAFNVIALGSGNTAVTQADKGIETLISGNGLDKVIGTVTMTNGSATADAGTQVSITNTYSPSGSATINEVALLNSTSGANDGMLARQVLGTGVSVQNGDTLTVTWTINIGNVTGIN